LPYSAFAAFVYWQATRLVVLVVGALRPSLLAVVAVVALQRSSVGPQYHRRGVSSDAAFPGRQRNSEGPEIYENTGHSLANMEYVLRH
jgi:hypothetical protein